MKTHDKIRIESSDVDRSVLDDLIKTLTAPSHPALVNEYGMRTALPAPVFQTLLKIVTLMREGRSIVLLPEDETFTTQAAANYLGMSRQFFVTLLENQEIPYHYVGTHRRVAFKDLIEYDSKRRTTRRKSLGSLSKRLVDAGVYDAEVDGGDAG